MRSVESNTATGKPVILKGCQKKVGRGGLSVLGHFLHVYSVSDEEMSLSGEKQNPFI